MNLSIQLNSEQESAANDLLVAYNKSQETPLTLEEYFQTVLIDVVNDKVAKNFEATANALVAGAKALPYESRVALIAQVQSQLGG
jgi:hypothetical protein